MLTWLGIRWKWLFPQWHNCHLSVAKVPPNVLFMADDVRVSAVLIAWTESTWYFIGRLQKCIIPGEKYAIRNGSKMWPAHDWMAPHDGSYAIKNQIWIWSKCACMIGVDHPHNQSGKRLIEVRLRLCNKGPLHHSQRHWRLAAGCEHHQRVRLYITCEEIYDRASNFIADGGNWLIAIWCLTHSVTTRTSIDHFGKTETLSNEMTIIWELLQVSATMLIPHDELAVLLFRTQLSRPNWNLLPAWV